MLEWARLLIPLWTQNVSSFSIRLNTCSQGSARHGQKDIFPGGSEEAERYNSLQRQRGTTCGEAPFPSPSPAALCWNRLGKESHTHTHTQPSLWLPAQSSRDFAPEVLWRRWRPWVGKRGSGAEQGARAGTGLGWAGVRQSVADPAQLSVVSRGVTIQACGGAGGAGLVTTRRFSSPASTPCSGRE